MYANVRGLKGKARSITDVSVELKPDIILLAETHLKHNKGVRINGYTFFGRPRTEGAGGGVGVLVSNNRKGIVAPHTTTREIEMSWVSLRRNKDKPIYIGIYYGKQESRVSKSEIEHEMDLLMEEIREKQREGDIIIAMDGNGKVGILNEKISRNGEMLLRVFGETNLHFLNKSTICSGQITRQNTKNRNECSAIDFVLCSSQLIGCIQKMVIDEEGIHKISGLKDTDHNTITVHFELNKTEEKKRQTPVYRINAPEEKWEEFRNALSTVHFDMHKNIGANITDVYYNWLKCIENIAQNTIGKTTKKSNTHKYESMDLKVLRQDRREAKKDFESEKELSQRKLKKEYYIEKQKQVRHQIEKEEKERTEQKVKQILSGDKNLFCKERSNQIKNVNDDWNGTKNDKGECIYDPEKNKENIALHYENLYKKPIFTHHPYHDKIIEENNKNMMDREHENADYNKMPNIQEIKEIIKKKKNGRSTSDVKNEILKRGGDEMTRLILPLVEQFWYTEKAADQWNEGIISTVWKGKGDREVLKNHRGITVSSGVGTIPEQIINERLLKIMHFTQFQAGGRKGCSTADHVFIVRGITSYALHTKKKIYLTFYDVEKAYDRADVQDMIYLAWKDGVRGKLWRLMRVMNEGLTATIKTKNGPTRKIERESGGKQGGKIIVTLFSRLMDALTEEMSNDHKVGINIDGKELNDLLYVDDALTFAEGKQQQEDTLERVSEFAIKHKLKWGPSKCNVLELGRHTNTKNEWNLGDKKIKGADSYKYLGDYIHRKGCNKQNIEERGKKLKHSTMEIILCGTSQTMRKMGSKVLIDLHDTINIPSLLYNAESWVLNDGDQKELERIELWCLKRILNLPPTTPSAALRYETNTLLVKIRIDKIQLLYLHKVLTRAEDHWTKHILNTLNVMNIGWAAEINRKLINYHLETEWPKIAEKPIGEWKNLVAGAVEEENKKVLLNMCYKDRGVKKTKTKYVIAKLEDQRYNRSEPRPIMTMNRLKTKAILMARSGMLECANNYKNKYKKGICTNCQVKDDEIHRINNCILYRNTNNYDMQDKFDYNSVYSDNLEDMEIVANKILSIWDLANGKNTMKNTGIEAA